jgi:hypothetical protein
LPWQTLEPIGLRQAPAERAADRRSRHSDCRIGLARRPGREAKYLGALSMAAVMDGTANFDFFGYFKSSGGGTSGI